MECRNPNTFGFRTEAFCSVLDLVRTGINAQIRTIGCSVFEQTTRLGHFIYIKILLWPSLYIKWSSLVAVWKPNIQNLNKTSSNDRWFGFQHYPNFGCSDFGIPLYSNLIIFSKKRQELSVWLRKTVQCKHLAEKNTGSKIPDKKVSTCEDRTIFLKWLNLISITLNCLFKAT